MKLTFLFAAFVFLAVCIFASEGNFDEFFDAVESDEFRENKVDEQTLKRLLDEREQCLQKQEEELQTREKKLREGEEALKKDRLALREIEKKIQARSEQIQKELLITKIYLDRRESLLDEREKRIITLLDEREQRIITRDRCLPNDIKGGSKQKKYPNKLLSIDSLKMVASYLPPSDTQKMKVTQTSWSKIDIYERVVHRDTLIIFLHLETNEYILQWKESLSDLFEWMEQNDVNRVKMSTGEVINFESTPLITAARKGQNFVRSLIAEKGNFRLVDIIEVTSHGLSALHAAASVGDYETCNILLKCGANWIIDNKSNDGFAPLHLAVKNGNDAAVDVLLMHEINVNVQDAAGLTPLMYAAKKHLKQIVYTLLSEGAHCNVQDVKGRTALMHATLRGHAEIVRILINSNANVSIPDANGHTAFTYASCNGNAEIERIITQAMQMV